MALSYPLVNGFAVSWASLTLKRDGDDEFGFREISWKNAIERAAVRGQGRQILRHTKGDLTPELSITYLLEEFADFRKALGAGYLDKNISYFLSYSEGTFISNVEFVGCLIKEEDCSHSQGPDGLTVTVPFDLKAAIVDKLPPIDNFRK